MRLVRCEFEQMSQVPLKGRKAGGQLLGNLTETLVLLLESFDRVPASVHGEHHSSRVQLARPEIGEFSRIRERRSKTKMGRPAPFSGAVSALGTCRGTLPESNASGDHEAPDFFQLSREVYIRKMAGQGLFPRSNGQVAVALEAFPDFNVRILPGDLLDPLTIAKIALLAGIHPPRSFRLFGKKFSFAEPASIMSKEIVIQVLGGVRHGPEPFPFVRIALRATPLLPTGLQSGEVSFRILGHGDVSFGGG